MANHFLLLHPDSKKLQARFPGRGVPHEGQTRYQCQGLRRLGLADPAATNLDRYALQVKAPVRQDRRRGQSRQANLGMRANAVSEPEKMVRVQQQAAAMPHVPTQLTMQLPAPLATTQTPSDQQTGRLHRASQACSAGQRTDRSALA